MQIHLRFTVITFLATLNLVCSAQAAIVYVDDSAPAGGDGQTWPTAFADLKQALQYTIATNAATPGAITEVRVATGTYTPAPPNGSRTETFTMPSGISLRGGYAGLSLPGFPDLRDFDLFETVLSGDLNGNDGPGFANNIENSYHVVTATNVSSATLFEGLTISGGNASLPQRYGGGIWNGAGSPVIDQCLFKSNWAHGGQDGGGGAVWSSGGTPHITNSTFLGNGGVYGGVDLNSFSGNATVTSCTFIANSGTALHVNSSGALVQDCHFEANYNGVYGSAVYNEFNSSTYKRCTFVRNEGLAFELYRQFPVVRDCTFVGATGPFGGTGLRAFEAWFIEISNCVFAGNDIGIFLWDARITVSNCTFAQNSIHDVRVHDNVDSGDPSTLINCILWSDTQNGSIHMDGDTLSAQFCTMKNGTASVVLLNDAAFNWGAGNLELHPEFTAAPQPGPDQLWGTLDDDYGNLRLLPGSPCIDAGSNGDLDPGDTDYDGNPRLLDGDCDRQAIVDFGAFELQQPAVPGDCTHDGFVNVDDLLAVVNGWGACDNAGACFGDCTNNGIVDVDDLLVVINHWGWASCNG